MFASLHDTGIAPFISGKRLPFYWARCTPDAIYVFLAHPATRNIHYPMQYRQSLTALAQTMELHFCWGKHKRTIEIIFGERVSVLPRLRNDGGCDLIDTKSGC